MNETMNGPVGTKEMDTAPKKKSPKDYAQENVLVAPLHCGNASCFWISTDAPA